MLHYFQKLVMKAIQIYRIEKNKLLYANGVSKIVKYLKHFNLLIDNFDIFLLINLHLIIPARQN